MKRFAQGLAIVALAIVAAACSGASAAPPSADPQETPSGDALVIVAKDMKFLNAAVVVKAGESTNIILDNQEAAPHNIAVKDASGETVFKGEIVSSKQAVDVLPPLEAGTYTFWCEVHPDMVGTIEAK
jgi:plastocyanin